MAEKYPEVKDKLSFEYKSHSDYVNIAECLLFVTQYYYKNDCICIDNDILEFFGGEELTEWIDSLSEGDGDWVKECKSVIWDKTECKHDSSNFHARSEVTYSCSKCGEIYIPYSYHDNIYLLSYSIPFLHLFLLFL